MANRGQTISELRWPETPDFMQVASAWKKDASRIMLAFVWQAYDILKKDVLEQVDSSDATDDLERDLTQLLGPSINKVMTGYEPFYIQPNAFEHESRQPSPAQPPAYDMAFVLFSNRRVMWPLEAKNLKTDKAVTEYVKEIKNNFLTCRYAPFSSEGGMIGYLFSGNPDKAFKNIAESLNCDLNDYTAFPERNHKISKHKRIVPKGKPYPHDFCCHHLILIIG